MTEKRFWCLDEYKGETSPIVDGKFAPTNEWLCNKLNELHEENQDNKAIIEFLSTENTQIWNELKTRTQIQHQLEEENEQLKYELTELKASKEDNYNITDGLW